jgi:hypothetical protein
VNQNNNQGNKSNNQGNRQAGQSAAEIMAKAMPNVSDSAKVELEAKAQAEATKIFEAAKAKALADLEATEKAKAEAEAKAKAEAEAKTKAEAEAKAKVEADAKVIADKVVADAKAAAEAVTLEAEKVERRARFMAKGPDGKYLDKSVAGIMMIPDLVVQNDCLENYIKLVLDNEAKEIIIQKPNRSAKLISDLKTLLVAPVEKIVADNHLTLADLEDKFVQITFQGGKVLINASTKAEATTKLKTSGGGKSEGERVESKGFIVDGTTVHKSLHAMAFAIGAKYEGINTAKEAVELCHRKDNGSYFKADGSPLLIPNGVLSNDKHYIRSAEAATKAGVSIVGCTKDTSSRYLPFYYEIVENGTLTLDGVTRARFVATKKERAVDALGHLVVTG